HDRGNYPCPTVLLPSRRAPHTVSPAARAHDQTPAQPRALLPAHQRPPSVAHSLLQPSIFSRFDTAHRTVGQGLKLTLVEPPVRTHRREEPRTSLHVCRPELCVEPLTCSRAHTDTPLELHQPHAIQQL